MGKLSSVLFELGWTIRNFLNKELDDSRGSLSEFDSQKSDSWNNNSSFDDIYSNPRYSTYACNLYHRSSDEHHRHND